MVSFLDVVWGRGHNLVPPRIQILGIWPGQVEGISEFRQTPWQAKAATEKARIRRDQKAATMRKLRAGDRASAPWKVWRFGL